MAGKRPGDIILHPRDNVAVALEEIRPGQRLSSVDVVAIHLIPPGHKIAARSIEPGGDIIKYGQYIGCACRHILAGEHIHTGDIRLEDRSRNYHPGQSLLPIELAPPAQRRNFAGFRRPDGRVGTRNYLGVLASVSCSGDVAHFIAEACADKLLPQFPQVDGVIALSHGGGCCQAPGSEGLEILQRTLGGYARNPNFGGVIVVGLGCEVNLVENLLLATGLQQSATLQTLTIQDSGGTTATIEAGLKAAAQMLPGLNACRRQAVSAEHLVVGLECGGSDAYSGITANPALGEAVDLIVRNGGTAILSETPEIYGAEHLLVARAATAEIGELLIERIRWWEEYTSRHGAEINNNPTPGNKAGGISTILEKSMGAVAKAGSTNLAGVYRYGEAVTGRGLVFMDTPGYDIVSITGMIAGGANLICFTTGRGTVCGFRPVPTMKIATNTAMFNRLKGDMDINCGRILDGKADISQMGAEIFEAILKTASGEPTKSEKLGFGGTEFVPWQMGAVL